MFHQAPTVASINSVKFHQCLIPCLIWHKGWEVMKWNDKYVFLYIYFNIRTIQRYVFTGWVLKYDCSYDTRPKNRLLWILALSFWARLFTGDAIRGIIVLLTKIHNKQFMRLQFGVLRWWYGRPLQQRKLHLAILTRTRTHQDDQTFNF